METATLIVGGLRRVWLSHEDHWTVIDTGNEYVAYSDTPTSETHLPAVFPLRYSPTYYLDVGIGLRAGLVEGLHI